MEDLLALMFLSGKGMFSVLSEVFWPKEEYSNVSLVQYLFYKQSLELDLNIELLYNLDIFCIRFLLNLYQYVHFF